MQTNRYFIRAASVLVLCLIAASCSSSTSTTTPSASPTAGGPTLASTFVLAAPPDCATNKFCGLGLKSVYGIEFKEIKSPDSGGKLTVAALTTGAVQVGELFSTAVYDPTLVQLVDDKHLELADNITPVIRTAVATDDVKTLLNAVSTKLTTDGMNGLNRQVDVDQKDAAAVAKAFLQQSGLLGATTTSGAGKTITVGVSGGFSESKIVGEMYAQVLENAGYRVKRKLDLGTRKISDPALFSGQIDVKPEYLASESLALDPNADATGDPVHTSDVLTALLQKKNVTVLDYSPAIDTNVFVVTKDTATKYGLVNVSDLAKPAA